jgi:signal transduction histidine kinase
LLDNALKYSNQDSKVEFFVDSSPNQVTFSIKDEGIGISNEDLAYIFDSFYRSNNIGNISGTGLGLAIVKQCVDLHEGEITVNSAVGNGTTSSCH